MKNYKTACPKISCGHLQDRGDCLREVLTILGFDWENFDGVLIWIDGCLWEVVSYERRPHREA